MKGDDVDEIEGFYEAQCGIRTLDLRHCDGAIQGDDRRRRDREELVVELQDLVPVRVSGRPRVRVHRVDGRLH